MQILSVVAISFYLFSTGAYLAFLYRPREQFNTAGFALLATGFSVHTVLIAAGFVSRGHLPADSLAATLTLASWSVAGVFLFLQYRHKLKILGVFASPMAAAIMLVAHRTQGAAAAQSPELFKSFWLVFHVVAILIGEAALALACGVGVLYLLQEYAIKTKRHGFVFKRLPSLDLLDSTGNACIVFGFTLLTVGLITGFIYAKAVWHRFWGWDPKEVMSGISWLLYAALLHGRLTIGWRGRKAAIMAIIGFALILFTFLGVNFLFQGHHGEFTRG